MPRVRKENPNQCSDFIIIEPLIPLNHKGICQPRSNTFAAKKFGTYLLNGGVIVIIMMTSPITQVALEASIGRRILLRIESEVPLANDVRAISKFSQILRKQFLLQRQTTWLRSLEHLSSIFKLHISIGTYCIT